MIPVYLKENQIGASSRKVYGLKGDKVFILTHSINMRLVIDESNNKYWVNINNLSDDPIQKDLTNILIKNSINSIHDKDIKSKKGIKKK